MSGADLLGGVLPLLPLAVASGIDLYLVLFFLGAAPLLGWPGGEPGPLAALATPPAVGLAALLYLFEILASRVPWAASIWNVANTPVRVVGSGLLALLVVHAVPVAPPGAATLLPLGAALLAGGIHVARTGWWTELDLEDVPRRIRLLTAVVEDALVVSLLFLTLDQPPAGAVLAATALLVGAWRIRAHLAAGVTAHGLVASAARSVLVQGRWRDGSTLPDRVRTASGAPDSSAHTVRSARAAAWGPAVSGRFRRGWIVVGLTEPTFVSTRIGTVTSIDLGGAVASRIRQGPLHTVVDLVLPDGRPCGMVVSREGPGPEALRQVFGIRGREPGNSAMTAG